MILLADILLKAQTASIFVASKNLIRRCCLSGEFESSFEGDALFSAFRLKSSRQKQGEVNSWHQRCLVFIGSSILISSMMGNAVWLILIDLIMSFPI
jgi:hypothetical protein